MLIYDAFLTAQANETVKLLTGTFKGLLVKSGTTCGSQNATINTLADFTVLNELSGTGYARADVTGLTVTRDSVNHRAEWSFNPITFPALSADNGTVAGFVLLESVTNIPVLFETLVLATNGTAVVVTPNATTGAIYAKQGT